MMRAGIRIIALDLDDTLLNTRKELSERSRAALERAAAAGIEVVPATGRFYRGIPASIQALPFLHYAITINGGEVRDIRSGEVLYFAEIPLERALEMLDELDTLPVIYDCYQEGWGWITEAMQRSAERYIDYAPSLEMLRRLRTAVPELKAWLRERGRDVQKLQVFTRDRALRRRTLESLQARYPDLAVTASLPNNIEINTAAANKGDALLALAKALQVPREETMAFGDGLNDLSMLRAAGVGVAMGNAYEELKAAADRVTAGCDEDGAARVIEELL